MRSLWILLLAAVPAALKSLPPIGRPTRATWPVPSIRPSIKSLPITSRSWLPAWTFSLKGEPVRADPSADPFAIPGAMVGTTSAATPIVVNGVMYLACGHAAWWRWTRERRRNVELCAAVGRRFSARRRLLAGRSSQNPPRILFTSGSKLIALNANTGKIDPGFGNEGRWTWWCPTQASRPSTRTSR